MGTLGKKKFIHLAIAFIIFLLLKLCLPLDSGLTPAGASVIGIFIATIYIWLTVGVDWTSLLAVCLLAFTGVTSAASVWQISWGGMIGVLVITVLILNDPVVKCGLAQAVANWFITRKATANRPYVFFLLFMLANFIVSCFLEMIPAAVIFSTIAKSILIDLGYTGEDKFSKALMLSVLWTSAVGNGATPLGHPITLTLLGILQNITGLSVSYLSYMAIGLPFGLIFVALCWLVIRYIIKPDCSKFDNYDIEKIKANSKPLDKGAKIITTVFMLVVFSWILPDLAAPFSPAFAGYIRNLGAIVPIVLGIGVLCIIEVDKKPLLNIREAMRDMAWSTALFATSIGAFSTVLTMESAGVTPFLINVITPIAAVLSDNMLVIVAFLILLTLTNLMSNGVSGTIVMSIFVPMILLLNDSGSSISVIGFGVLVSFVAQTAFMTPSSCAPAPLIYSSGYVTTSDGAKYGFPLVLMSLLVASFIVFPFAQLIL